MTGGPRLLKTIAVAAAGLALFAAAVGVVGAQRGGPPPTGGPQPGREGQPPSGPMADAYVSDLASNLGVSEDDLRAAMAQTRQDMQPMVQQQMDEMRQRMQDRMGDMPDRMGGRPGGDGADGGPRPGFGFGMQPFAQGGPGGPGERGMAMRAHMMGMVADMVDTVAGALNMSPDDLHAQIRSGQSVADVARAQGKDPDALADQITNALIQKHQGELRDMIRRGMDRQFAGRGGQSDSD